MPLHLLGKKSWNVYGGDNIDRVRRDEAAAQAREEAEEQRMQGEDAAYRMAVLRGGEPASLPAPVDQAETRHDASLHLRERKRRRLRGEDDTDRDIRHAREDNEAGQTARLLLTAKRDVDAPLLDHAGHLQLIPAPDEKTIRKAEKNAEAEAEKDRKRERDEDQYTMRFSNAAGFKHGMEKPWWAAKKKPVDINATETDLPHVQNKDAWGNEDGRRKEREMARISTNDPFAVMGQAQRQLKELERQRREWANERAAEMAELQRAEERKRRHGRRRVRGAGGDLDEPDHFSLDAPAALKHRHSGDERKSTDAGNGERERRHRRRHRSGSRSRATRTSHHHDDHAGNAKHRRRRQSTGVT